MSLMEEFKRTIAERDKRIAELEAQKKQDRTMYETLLRESYPIPMNACKCGRGKRNAYELCMVCRIAELEEISQKWEDRYFSAMDNNKQLEEIAKAMREGSE